MEKIYEMILSPIWWITVVVTGILINILSSYLRDLLDKRLSKLLKWWENRSEKRIKEKNQYIKRIKYEERFLTLHMLRDTKYRTWAILWILLANLCILIVFIIPEGYELELLLLYLLATISFFWAIQNLSKSEKFAEYVKEALDTED